MQAIDNPRHRFEKQYVEWLEEPPPARLEVHEETSTKEILAKNDSPDVGFTYSLNPYRGCTHACAYCYARPSHEYLGYGAGTDFETKIVVKVNAPELLRKRLASRTWTGEAIAFSGDTDCYQPLEASYGLTRGCLEACRDAANPVLLITKSWLISRDVPLLADMSQRARVTACMSIAFADDAMSKLVEPGAPRPSKRFEAMRRLADAGVRTGVIFAPIIPGLNEDQIPEVLERTKEAGGQFASRVLLRLPHAVKDIFLERMRRELPDRAKRIESRIRDVRGGALNDPSFGSRMSGKGSYWEIVEQTFRIHATRLGLIDRAGESPEASDRPLREAAPLASRRAARPAPTPATTLGPQLSLFD